MKKRGGVSRASESSCQKEDIRPTSSSPSPLFDAPQACRARPKGGGIGTPFVPTLSGVYGAQDG